ncbi:MAG TPA: SIR2 family protein [Rhodanobacter sp.]|jgi:hypothetical protein|nr:SIR2 family protein [Rhodanobacter sp.]
MDYKQTLAFAAASNALCLFTGSGFSKNLSGGTSPDWAELLAQLCDLLNDPGQAKAQLEQARATYPLEDCAQILELAFLREGRSFKDSLAELISRITLSDGAAESLRRFLSDNKSTVVVTTNYDSLVQQSLAGVPFVTNYSGKPIARKPDAIQIFHVHGSIESPSSIIATSSDYYQFINQGGYFSQKTLTLMHESTVVILGYSLSDTNLKAILSDLHYHGMRSISRGNIFYVTRGVVPAYIRDYYEAAYGMVVLENLEINVLLNQISQDAPAAKQQLAQAEADISDVIAGRKQWVDNFIKLRDSLFKIFATANVNGVDFGSRQFTSMISDLLTRKRGFCNQFGAWDQYEHLADWLVHIGTVIDIRGSDLENSYLDALNYSMNRISSTYERGKSWYAYGVWKSKWKFISFDNKLLVRAYTGNNAFCQDALNIVNS